MNLNMAAGHVKEAMVYSDWSARSHNTAAGSQVLRVQDKADERGKDERGKGKSSFDGKEAM